MCRKIFISLDISGAYNSLIKTSAVIYSLSLGIACAYWCWRLRICVAFDVMENIILIRLGTSFKGRKNELIMLSIAFNWAYLLLFL